MLLCGQKIAFSERSKGIIEDFLKKKNGQLVVSYQVETDPCCGLPVIFCGFISRLIGRETINIPEIFSGVHGFTGKDCKSTRRENNYLWFTNKRLNLLHNNSTQMLTRCQIILNIPNGNLTIHFSSTRHHCWSLAPKVSCLIL